MNSAEIREFAAKTEVKVRLEIRDDPEAHRAHREAFAKGSANTHASGKPARLRTLQSRSGAVPGAARPRLTTRRDSVRDPGSERGPLIGCEQPVCPSAE